MKMGMRRSLLLFCTIVTVVLFYTTHVFGFVVAKKILCHSRFNFNLKARGFSKESNDPKLTKEAKDCLKEAKGVLEAAQGIYFRRRLMSLKSDDPSLYRNMETFVPYNIKDDVFKMQVHEKLVEYTWDTIAAYLPLTAPTTTSTTTGATTTGGVELPTSKKLDVIARTACFQPNVAVMDVGCGNGIMVPYLKRAGADLKAYFGLDLSGQMINAAKTLHPDLSFDKTNFLTCSTANKYDVILLNGVLQFLPSSTSDTLRRAASLLKPSGRIVIAHVNGARFVRDEKNGNPNTVLAEMPDEAYVQAIGEEIGAQFFGLKDIIAIAIAANADADEGCKYSIEEDMYLCVLQMPPS